MEKTRKIIKYSLIIIAILFIISLFVYAGIDRFRYNYYMKGHAIEDFSSYQSSFERMADKVTEIFDEECKKNKDVTQIRVMHSGRDDNSEWKIQVWTASDEKYMIDVLVSENDALAYHEIKDAFATVYPYPDLGYVEASKGKVIFQAEAMAYKVVYMENIMSKPPCSKNEYSDRLAFHFYQIISKRYH